MAVDKITVSLRKEVIQTFNDRLANPDSFVDYFENCPPPLPHEPLAKVHGLEMLNRAIGHGVLVIAQLENGQPDALTFSLRPGVAKVMTWDDYDSGIHQYVIDEMYDKIGTGPFLSEFTLNTWRLAKGGYIAKLHGAYQELDPTETEAIARLSLLTPDVTYATEGLDCEPIKISGGEVIST